MKKRTEPEDNDASMPHFMAEAKTKAAKKTAERAKQRAAKKKAKASKRAEQEAKEAALARWVTVNEPRLDGNGRQNLVFFTKREAVEGSDEESTGISEEGRSDVAVVCDGTEREWSDEDEDDDDEEANFGVSFATKLSVQPSPLCVSSAPSSLPPAFDLDGGGDDVDEEPSTMPTRSNKDAKLGGKAQKRVAKDTKKGRKKNAQTKGHEESDEEDPKEIARRARDAKLVAKAEAKKKYAAFEGRMLPKLAESHPLAKRRQVNAFLLGCFC